ncbi:hypothetical protein [Actinophytocola sp.]|uniref:hypothetical protein n=1 Tax=Actinophytocola sp. TaxID=1872138 RepID=UPI003899815E
MPTCCAPRRAATRTRSAVRTWLYGVARRQAHNRLRSLSTPPDPLDDLREPAATEPGPEEIALVRADMAVAAAMAPCPPGIGRTPLPR